MRPSAERRVDCLERALAARRRTRYLWQGDEETDAALRARIRAMIASGKAGPNDRLVTFGWRSPARDGG
jgi:hypothetical protein